MGFLIRDLLKLKAMERAHFIGSDSALMKPVTGITVMDSPDIANWLKGGEVILTSLFPVRAYSDVEMKEWAIHLCEENVSALIIKLDKVFLQIPAAIVRAFEVYDIPIITIPIDVPFIDILYPVMEKLFNNKVVELQYYKDVHERFTALSLADEGVQNIIATLEELIDNPVAVFDRYLHCIATTNDNIALLQSDPTSQIENEFSHTQFTFYRQSVVGPTPTEQSYNQVVVPIEAVNHIKINLVISELNHPTVALDFMAIENAAVALSLELVKQFAVAEVERKFQNDLIDDLVAGKMDSLKPVYERANVIGWDLHGEHVVVLFHLLDHHQEQRSSNPSPHPKQLHEYYQLLSEIINFYLATAIVRIKSDVAIVLWKIQVDEKNKLFWIEGVKKIVKSVQEKFKKHTDQFVLQIGIGDVASSILDVPKSYERALDALGLGKFYHKTSFISSFDELGIYRLLYQFQDTDQLRRFIPESLQKLINYRISSGNDLIETLRVFLQCNQNAAKTAQTLYIHYKTVSYRIQRIKEIMGVDFDNAEEVLSLQVGLKIMDMTQMGKETSIP